MATIREQVDAKYQGADVKRASKRAIKDLHAVGNLASRLALIQEARAEGFIFYTGKWQVRKCA